MWSDAGVDVYEQWKQIFNIRPAGMAGVLAGNNESKLMQN